MAYPASFITWTTGQVVTAANLNEQIRDTAVMDKAHVDATSNIHGVGSGVYPLGIKSGAARRIEIKSGTASIPNGSNQSATVTVTWDSAFSTILAVATFYTVAKGGSASYANVKPYADTGVNALSTTGASQQYQTNTDNTGGVLTVYFIAIGY